MDGGRKTQEPETGTRSGSDDATRAFIEIESHQRKLTELVRSFSAATANPRGLVDVIARGLAQLVGEACSIRLVVDGELEAVGSYHHADPELARAGRRLVSALPRRLDDPEVIKWLGDGMSRRLDIADATALLPEADEEQRAAARLLGPRSVILVPLMVGGKLLGFAAVSRGAPAPPYSESEQQLVEDAARHAALAIANARLLAETQAELAQRIRMQRRLQQLSELSRAFAAATGDSAKLLDLVARRIGEILGEACVIRLATADGSALELEGSVHHPDPDVVDSLRQLIGLAQRAGDGYAGRALSTGEVVIVDGTTDDLVAGSATQFAEFLRSHRVTSFLAAPLRSGGRVIGVVSMLRSGRAPAYTEEDGEFIEELLAHAALAIHNSRLIESTRRELAERQRAEAALRRSEEQLRHAQKMEAIGRLAGGVAHDFNNLLSVILSYSGFVLEDLEDEAPHRIELEQIQTAGRRAAELTRQLLAFSRQQVLTPKVLDLNAVVHETERMIRRVLGEDVAIRTVLAPDAGRIKADPGHLDQVIMNLVVNARDAMPCGGTLTISTANVELDESSVGGRIGVQPGSYVMLALTDTGMGMDADTQEHIFEPFFTTKDQGKGTGLGLSTVFGIVEQSGGTMWVESRPGNGATFRICLPRTAETPTSASPVRASPVRGDETIMLVEDEEQVRRVVRRILERGGYRVLAAADGPEAIRMLERHTGTIDMLLTDVVMPEMSGRELAERLRARRPGLRVLYMSGYNDETILHHRVLSGGAALLEKPVSADALLHRVRDVLARPS